MNCGIGGDRIQHVLWSALHLPAFFSNLKNVVFCGTNNLLLDSLEVIGDDILEIARSFKTNYSYIDIVIRGILPCEDSWSVIQVSVEEVEQISKLLFYE